MNKSKLSGSKEEVVASKDYEAVLSALNKTALVSVTDAKGIITYANDKFVEVSKFKRDELIGQNHRILKSGHQSDEVFVELWKSISSGKSWRGEIKNRAKDGSYYWVDTSIAPILDENGRPKQYIAVRFLITNVKAATEQLEKQNKQLEQFNQVLVQRELKMVKLKDELKRLKNVS